MGTSYSIILNCYASGDIAVTMGRVGGLIGHSINAVYGFFAVGNVRGDFNEPGNVIGRASSIYTYDTYKYSGQKLYSYGSLMESGIDTDYMYTMIYASDV